jgi:lactate dehydrogenase-like 2-hydroxyacid dehydrogenase
MNSIGFLTPYRHLPRFSKFVESNFTCKTDNVSECDYIFAAPNYLNFIIDDSFLKSSKVKAIITPSTGDNHINVSIPVISIKNDKILKEIYSTAEHNLYLCLALPRHIGEIVELKEKTLGIVGYGRLGKLLKEISTNIFKKVLVCDTDFIEDNFFRDVDFISVNIDYRKSNINYINKEYVGKFRKNIYIVNTSRGEVVNEEDIVNLIYDGKVLGYATDVIKEEHTSKATILKTQYDNRILITPHVGGTALEAQEKAYKRVIEKIL